MESESQLDLVILSIYEAKTTDKIQPIITKNVPILLRTLDPSNTPKPLDQKKVIKTINDVLVFIKKHNDLTVPYDELVNLILKSKNQLVKNITAVFIKLGIQRQIKDVNLQILMDSYSKLPPTFQPFLFSSYVSQVERLDPIEFIKTIQTHEDQVSKLTTEEASVFTSFLHNNLRIFYQYPSLFVSIYMKLECQKSAKNASLKNLPFEIEDGVLPNSEKIAEILDQNFDKYNSPVETARLLYLISKLNYPFKSFDNIASNTDLPFGLQCLDRQLSCQPTEVIKDHISHLVMVTTDNISKNPDLHISILRTLMKKCPQYFAKNLSLFKTLFDSDDIPRSTRSSIIYLFASIIEPSKKLLSFLESEIFNDEDVLAMSILKFIYPFNEPRTKVLACLLISNPDFTDECRIVLNPYDLVEKDGIRSSINISESKANAPTTTELFSVIEKDTKFHNFLLQSSSTKNISALFNFATICKPTYPLPYSFIVNSLDSCPNSANEISAFLVYVTKHLPKDPNLDPKPFLDYIITESDASIIESISSFLEWSGCTIDADKISSSLKGSQKIAFLSHFACPFDECFKMLSTPGQVSLAKNCIMAMALRGLLDKSHFEKLFPLISKDPIGVEILSTIAARDVELCEKLTKQFFDIPLINTEHVEVVVSGANKLSTVVSEDFLIDLIETGMKSDKSRRNSSIFLLYLVNHIVVHTSTEDSLKLPKRLWFCVRTLLFCCGAENGVVRTAGFLGLNTIYRKTYTIDKNKAKEIDDALYGRSRPEQEANSVQIMSGQPRASVVSLLLKLAKSIPSFMDFLITLIEPDFLIFPDIDIPSTEYTTEEERDGYASKFFYNSFSPNETTAESFRRLWRWSTDGGKKISIPDLIDAIEGKDEVDPNGGSSQSSTSWDTQKQNLNCVQEIISRMSQEQTAEHFEKLCGILMKLVFSPVSEMSVSGSGGLDKLVLKVLGQNSSERNKGLNKELQNFLINLCAKLLDTRIAHLIVYATKWASLIIPEVSDPKDMIVIYKALFTGLGSTSAIPNMLTGPTWPVFTKAVFRSCELDLHPFLDYLKDQLKTMIVLDSQRYALYYALDSVFRASSRLVIAKDVPNIMPTLFTLISNERSESVVKMIISLITHGLHCILYGKQEVFPYAEYVMKLFFDDQKVEICGSIMKAISRDCAECLTPDVSPFIVFASCYDIITENEIKSKNRKDQEQLTEEELDKEKELKSRDFLMIVRDEIPLSIQVNSNPQKFVDFALENGVNSTRAALYKPIGSRALLKIVKAMGNDTKSKISKYLLDKIVPLLSGRMFPSKECLIDVITELIGSFTVEQNVVDELKAAAMRQKSIYRASAIDCLRKIIITNSFDVPRNDLLNILIDVMANGALVAQIAAANCAEFVKNEEKFIEFINKTYEKMNSVDLDNVDAFCKLVLNLPPHEIPDLFDKQKFIKLVAPSKDKTDNIEKFLAKIK